MSRRGLGPAATAGVVFGGVLIVAAFAIGLWAFRVATSEPKGRGDAVIEKNSAANWTAAQARFESLYAEIVATDRKVTLAHELLATDPGNRTARDTYVGTRNVCLSFVADYNAAARSYLAGDFRAADLPAQITTTDPDTDCKE